MLLKSTTLPLISIHALLAESDVLHGQAGKIAVQFLSTLSLRRATRALKQVSDGANNFYPRSPCGERRRQGQFRFSRPYFYPRSPCGERPDFLLYKGLQQPISIHALLAESDTLALFHGPLQRISIHALLAESDKWSWNFIRALNISIHALLAESDSHCIGFTQRGRISIHALLAESDPSRPGRKDRRTISIHALLAESDVVANLEAGRVPVFLSTLSLRRATAPRRKHTGPTRDFYPRSPCGERHLAALQKMFYNNFYPRSPCGERPGGCCGWQCYHEFLSTLSLRRATLHVNAPSRGFNISIHALLAESDPKRIFRIASLKNFYPRSPCGERPIWDLWHHQTPKFLSTLSLRRATDQHAGTKRTIPISIHALLAESDP